MTTHITVPRSLRIATFVVFTTGALAIVLQDIIDLRNPLSMWQHWTLAHSLAVLAVAAVTLTAEMAWSAFRLRRPIVGLGFILVTVVGLGLIVFNSVGRQAEAAIAKNAPGVEHNGKVAAAQRRLDKAETAKTNVDAVSITKAAEKDCARNCVDLLKQTQADATAEVAAARKALNDLGVTVAVSTVSAKAKQWGETLSLVGVPPALTEQLANRLEYVFWTLLFEIGSMVSGCFVFDRRALVALAATVAATDEAKLAELRERFFAPDNDPSPQPTPPGNRRRKQPSTTPATKPTVASRPTATVTQLFPSNRAQKVSELAALAWLREYTDRNGFLPDQDTMATELDVNKGSVSKWLEKWELEGLIERQQNGRCKVVRMTPSTTATG